MPIEIRELIIRATIQADNDKPATQDLSRDEAARAELVEDCVEEVLRILRERQER